MRASRYVRVGPGAFVCQRPYVQGIVAHLHDLARHLEGLMPDPNELDTMTRSRDYAGGFATLNAYERELDRAVLEALAERPADAAYEPLSIEGFDDAKVEATVYRLWKTGHVDAHSLIPKQVTPSALTTKGVRQLRKLSTGEKVGA